MNMDANRQRVQGIKAMYPKGARIELTHMSDPYAPVEPGTRGTVKFVDDVGTVFPDWDNGRTLGVIPGEDSFRKLTPEGIEAERQVMEGGDSMTLWL